MVWKVHGMPMRIATDRGPELTNKFIDAICDIVGTMHCSGFAMHGTHHCQSDRQTEHVNKVLEDMLQHYINPKQNDWDELLAPAELFCWCLMQSRSMSFITLFMHSVCPSNWQ